MERVYSAIWSTPQELQSQTDKRNNYKAKQTDALHKKQKRFQLVRQQEAKGTHTSSLQLFAKYCLSGFAKGYLFKMMFSLVFRIVKRPTQFFRKDNFVSQELLRFGSSVGLVVGLYRGILSFLRQKRYQQQPTTADVPITDLADRYDRAVAGFIGGLGLLINDGEYRQFASKYAFVRALDLLRNTAERKEWIPRIEKLSYYLFGLINGPIMYSLLVDPSLLTPWYYEWILWMGDLSKVNIHKTVHHYVQTGTPQPSNPCEGLLYPTGASRWYIGMDWFYGLYRASTMYGPVHLVPMLLFRTREVMNNPIEMCIYFIKNVCLSSCFLSSYQFIVKMSAMPLMEISQSLGFDGTVWPGKFWLCGILTAFACEFERPSRVNELFIYCATHTMDVVWNWLCQKGLVSSIAYGEVAFFCVACSITFSTELQDIKPTYRSMLQYLLEESSSSTEDVEKEKELIVQRV